ncbi:MAG: hypothetical protein ACSHX6_16095 [Akkermansiaceae bacterium]
MIKMRMQKMRVLLVCMLASAMPVGLTNCGATAESIGGVGTRSAVGSIGYDSKEKQILGQARAVGAVGGAIAGALLADKLGIKNSEGAILGGLLGGVIGNQVGKNQANNAKNKRLSNQNLQSMIAAAKDNNRKLAAYNRRVDQRIAQLRAKSAAERKQLARVERKSVDNAIKQTDSLIQSRQATVAKLHGSDKAMLAKEVRIAQNHRATLAKQRQTLVGYESLASN